MEKVRRKKMQVREKDDGTKLLYRTERDIYHHKTIHGWPSAGLRVVFYRQAWFYRELLGFIESWLVL